MDPSAGFDIDRLAEIAGAATSEHVSSGPGLAPLAVDSPVARALYGLWTGTHRVEVHVDDHMEQIAAAATVAAHLAVRARLRVNVRVDAGDRTAVVSALCGQLPKHMVAAPPLYGDDAVKPPEEEVGQSLDGPVGALVYSWSSALVPSADITVVLERQLANTGPRCVIGRVAHVTDRPTCPAKFTHSGYRLTDTVPLDIVFAGAPET